MPTRLGFMYYSTVQLVLLDYIYAKSRHSLDVAQAPNTNHTETLVFYSKHSNGISGILLNRKIKKYILTVRLSVKFFNAFSTDLYED